MNKFQIAIILFGLIMIAMGLQAFLVDGSKASLIAGGGVGVLEIGLAAYSKTNPRIGFIGASIVALLPLGRFLPHLFKGGQLVIYPSLVGSILCIGLALYLVGGHLVAKRKSRAASPAEPPAA